MTFGGLSEAPRRRRRDYREGDGRDWRLLQQGKWEQVVKERQVGRSARRVRKKER